MDMDTALESFWDELESGEVHVRDKWQFELKSEFFTKGGSQAEYIQDFYLFIPDSLQINRDTYNKAQFYADQTNMIRYKTPEFLLKELVDPQRSDSPLNEMAALSHKPPSPENVEQFSYQLKLFGNVVRSSCRAEIKTLIWLLENKQNSAAEINAKVDLLCANLQKMQDIFHSVQARIKAEWKESSIDEQLRYIDQFIVYTFHEYLAGFLKNIRMQKDTGLYAASDQNLCTLLMQLEKNPFFRKHENIQEDTSPAETEKILYMRGLLNKFVIGALLLTVNRRSLDERYYHWIGALSAGIAMLIFLGLYAWIGTVFVINSLPFILLTVLFYILKDRIKDLLRFLSSRHASKWYSDFTTAIYSPEDKRFGMLRETFSFVPHEMLPQEISKMRNKEFHQVLEAFQRPEAVLYYKRTIKIEKGRSISHIKSRGINIIFRFNILRFLRKAGNSYETHFLMDPQTHKLVSINLPKVYHLNLIIRSNYVKEDGKLSIKFKKLRIILDKNGIKRIEQLR